MPRRLADVEVAKCIEVGQLGDGGLVHGKSRMEDAVPHVKVALPQHVESTPVAVKEAPEGGRVLDRVMRSTKGSFSMVRMVMSSDQQRRESTESSTSPPC